MYSKGFGWDEAGREGNSARNTNKANFHFMRKGFRLCSLNYYINLTFDRVADFK